MHAFEKTECKNRCAETLKNMVREGRVRQVDTEIDDGVDEADNEKPEDADPAARLAGHLRHGLTFLRMTQPTPHTQFIFIRTIGAPLTTMYRKQCLLSSRKFEERERIRSVKAAKAGRTGLTRNYRVLVLATGEIKRAGLEKLMS